MRVRLIFLLSVSLASCDRTEKTAQIPRLAGQYLYTLPSSSFSREFENDESGFIEIVISDDTSELFHQGNRLATTSSDEDLFAEIKQVREKNHKLGVGTPLLISAPAATGFNTIRARIRTAAKTGIYQILFLVRSDQSADPEVVSIELPTMGDQLPDIEPYFLHTNSEGHVFSGTGPSSTRMDIGSQDRRLEKLSAQLELLKAAAESAGSPNALCQIYINPQTTYQRFIDLISLTNKYRISPFFTDMEPEMKPETPKPIERLIRKPTPPNSYLPIDLRR